MIPLMTFIIGAFCGASIMWIWEDHERKRFEKYHGDQHFAEWVNDGNKRASEWLRRGQ